MATVIGESVRVEMHDGRRWAEISDSAEGIALLPAEGVTWEPVTFTVTWNPVDWRLLETLLSGFRWRPWVTKVLLAAALLALTLVMA